IRFSVPQSSDLSLTIYNLTGQEMNSWSYVAAQPGSYEKIWGGTDKYGRGVASGVYIYRFVAGNYVQTAKMLLLK
ncbi:MAG: T9SS type A sorting domain-containing protein, partial [Candidatus Marinimicrobia bacterium]|nr:T9SS type A sorting domain-containing protein [Candidatus Neomarinimicrobiota bacterium]